MKINFVRTAHSLLSLTGATLVMAIGFVSSAQAGVAGITCPNGVFYANLPSLSQCPSSATPPSSQPGVTGQTMTGMMTSIGQTIGNALGGSSGGGGSGGTAGAGGVTRVALSGETGAAAAAGSARWNAWLAYSQANVSYSFQPLQTSGDQKVVLGGIDYAIANNVVIGVALSDEKLRATTSYNGGSINGKGNTIAPYLGWRINQNWAFDATLASGTTKLDFVDNSTATRTTGANQDRRSLVSAGLAYNQSMRQWLFTGKGTLLTAQDKFSAFTTSGGTFVNSSATRTTQARLLGQAMYNAGMFLPFVGVTYIYDLERPFQGAVGGQSAANDRDGWQLRAGVNFRSSGALYGGVQIASEVGRSQVKSDQILFNLGMRF